MIALLKALAIGWASLGGGPVEAHITPTVELVSHEQAVRRILQGASAFYLREVRLGKAEVSALNDRVGWVPEDKTVRIFIGREADGREVGSVVFVLADSRHGPLRLAVGLAGDGTVKRVIITHATEETVPWVSDVLKAGLLDQFAGRTEATVDSALDAIVGEVRAMPRYMGQVTVRGVHQALALYAVASAV